VIHSTAILSPDVRLGDGADVGPYSVLGVDGQGGPLVVGERCVVRSHVVIYRGTTIGADFHAGHGALVRDKTIIGDRVSVGSHSIVEFGVVLEDGVRLHSGCFVPERSVLRRDAWLGPGVLVTNARYPNRPDTKQHLEGVEVGEKAVIGAGAVLLPGLRIGAGALVGAGAVVVRDVAEGAVVTGNGPVR
jgi:acetyltransferase-like isoleucine patch superfamily enzyme